MIADRVRLRFVAPLRTRTAPAALKGDVAFLPMDAIGDDGTYRTDSVRPANELNGAGYTYFEEGDVVRARVTPCFENRKGALLSKVVGRRGFGTTELFVFKPSQRIDARFLYYLTISSDFTERGTATMYGAHGVRRVDEQFARNYRAWVPPLERQRAIAHYLDRETARIDALIGAKKRMVGALDDRLSAAMERIVRTLAAQWPVTRLKFACREIVVGIVITPAAWYAAPGGEGVPAIRGINVRAGSIDLTGLVHLTPDGHALHRKSTLRQGDVVVVRTGQTGAAAVVPAALAGANCIDLVIVRAASRLDPFFLQYVLNSDWTQKHIEKHSVGTIQSHFNVGAMRDLPIPLPPLDVQHAAVTKLDALNGEARSLRRAIDRQLELVAEHRQALITAAVTGQLDIPEAA